MSGYERTKRQKTYIPSTSKCCSKTDRGYCSQFECNMSYLSRSMLPPGLSGVLWDLLEKLDFLVSAGTFVWETEKTRHVRGWFY